MGLTELIAQAIAQMEGFFKPGGSIAARNNNPGNLRSWGSNPVVDGYAKFPTLQAGWDALRAQVDKNIGRGLTLQEFFGGKPGVYPGYAPAVDRNDPGNYANFVATQAGISPTIALNTIGDSPGNPTKPPKAKKKSPRGDST